jgi:hypothetical protein
MPEVIQSEKENVALIKASRQGNGVKRCNGWLQEGRLNQDQYS